MSPVKAQLIDQLFKYGNLYEELDASQNNSFNILRKKYWSISSASMKGIRESLGGENYINRVKQVYDQIFTENEIKEICAFWASETGRKLVKGDFIHAIKLFHQKWATEVEEACSKLSEDVL